MTRKAATVPGRTTISCESKTAAVTILKTGATLGAYTKMVLRPCRISGPVTESAE